MIGLPSNFVDLKYLSNVRLDIRYATSNNFMEQVVRGYNAEMCWMHRDGFEMLRILATRLEVEGLGLWIWDAYRPKSATQHMVEWVRETNQQWILDEGFVVEDSRHNRGGAIDLTLYDLATQTVLDMGTDWDHFGPEGHWDGVSGIALDNRRKMRQAMNSVGFVPYDLEWWHFELPNALELPVFDVPYV